MTHGVLRTVRNQYICAKLGIGASEVFDAD